MTARKLALQRLNRIYKLIKNDNICVYCGVRATTIDHFVPISIINLLAELVDVRKGLFLIPCCRECNALAGNKIFPTIAAKRRYLHKRLRAKYKKLLASPLWREPEMADLGPLLSSRILAGEAKRQWVLERLEWRNKSNPAAVELAAIYSRLGGFGSNSARRNATTSGTHASANNL